MKHKHAIMIYLGIGAAYAAYNALLRSTPAAPGVAGLLSMNALEQVALWPLTITGIYSGAGVPAGL